MSATSSVKTLSSAGVASTSAQQTGGYCITAVSASGKSFYYNSQSGGLTTTAC